MINKTDNFEKIRIMHIAQAAGGVSRYLQMLLKYMDRNKYENILVCSHDYKYQDFKNIADAIESIEMQRNIGLKDFWSIFVVRKLIKKYNPHIVYAHSSKAGAIVRLANTGIRNRCIYNPHGWAFDMKLSQKTCRIYIFLEKVFSFLCDQIICISDAEKKSAIKKNICSPEKLHVIRNGIDIEEYENHPYESLNKTDLNIPENAFIIGTVGRLTRQKAPDTFIFAAEKIKEKIPNAYFIMVGNGEQKNKIEKYAETHGLKSSLLITGWINNPMKYVELFDVAMLLSRWEGFGLVLPEYMISKKPIVATNVDAIPEIIKNGINGLLVSVDNIEEICHAVIELYGNPDLRKKITECALNNVYSEYDIKRVSKEHEIIFNQL